MKVLVSLLFLFTTISVAQDDLALGKSALNKKSYDEAIQSFQKYLAANSRNVEANFLLGETYRSKGDFLNSQSALERTLNFDDEYEPALASIIRVYGKLGMWDKAAKRFKEAEKYHKKGILAPLSYGQTFLEADSLDKASIYFFKVKEIDPKNVDAYLGLAEVYSRQNVIISAVDNIRIATKIDSMNASLHYKLASAILKNRALNADQIREVTAALQKSIELDPKNEKAIYDAANTFYRIKYWREAATFFKKYVELVQTNAEAWLKYAISLYNAKSYLEAIPALEQAITMNPKNDEMKPMLAHSLYLAKEYQKSLNVYKNIPLDSLNKDEVYRMGYSYFQTKDTVKAITYLEKTITMDTAHTDAIGTLAAVFLNQKKYKKASVLYEKLLSKDPKNVAALFYAGFSYFVLGKNDTAKNYYKQLIALRPNNVQSHQSLMRIYSLQDSAEQGRYHANIVVGLADSVMKADPSKASQQLQIIIGGYQMLASFDYKEKNIKGAVEKLEKAVNYEKGKKDENLHLFLAQMYAVQSGDKELLATEAKVIKEKACKEYQVVLKINPKNKNALKESTQMNCGK